MVNRSHGAETRALESEVLKLFKEAKLKSLAFLLVGCTGAGKSSTVNRLVGREIASTGKFAPETARVDAFCGEIEGFEYRVYDTPGLCDEESQKGNDKRYMGLIREEINEIDLLLYVVQLPRNRVGADEKRAIRILTRTFGKRVWNHALVVFTFSRDVPDDEFQEWREKRSTLILEEIRRHAPNAKLEPEHFVCIDNVEDLEGEDVGLPELWAQAYARMESKGLLPFLFSQARRLRSRSNDSMKPLKICEDGSESVALSTRQREIIVERTKGSFARLASLAASCAAVGATVGAAISAGLGSAIGASIGALIGGLLGLFRRD